jgi:hypothetical protein
LIPLSTPQFSIDRVCLQRILLFLNLIDENLHTVSPLHINSKYLFSLQLHYTLDIEAVASPRPKNFIKATAVYIEESRQPLQLKCSKWIQFFHPCKFLPHMAPINVFHLSFIIFAVISSFSRYILKSHCPKVKGMKVLVLQNITFVKANF